MQHIIALHGKRLAGKNYTAGPLLTEGYVEVKFATQLYNELIALGFSWKQIEEEKEILRPIMMAIGDARRHFDEDHYARLGIADAALSGSRVVITDLRFQNEAKMLRQFAAENDDRKVTLVRIDRPDFERKEPSDRHKSECDLDLWTDWDMIVSANSGELKKLEAAADALAMSPEDDIDSSWGV